MLRTPKNIPARRRMMISATLVLLLISHTVTCRPSTQKSNKLTSIGFQKAYDNFSGETEHRLEKCYSNSDLNELCQRCEKISERHESDVYSMCCANEDNATDYCRKYVYYGVT